MRSVATGMTSAGSAHVCGKPDWPASAVRIGPASASWQDRRLAARRRGFWACGSRARSSCSARLARDIRRIAQVASRAATLRRGPLADLLREVAADLGIRRPVRIAISRELAVPVTWGFRRPVVLLPAAARRWDAERRRVVLRHELAHVRRGDYAGHLLIELACALHWPNPFAWRAAYRARLEQEQACDDRVVALGTGPIDYAQQLLDIARAFVVPRRPRARRARHGGGGHACPSACAPSWMSGSIIARRAAARSWPWPVPPCSWGCPPPRSTRGASVRARPTSLPCWAPWIR